MQFAWDDRKAQNNIREDGVSFEEALTVFSDPLARIHDDLDHSIGERREVITGHSDRGRPLLVFFTEKGEAVRIISARAATAHERRDYEEGTQ
ncbi:MAG TPA: BrnT family toxin [Thermoanaerobaculia bacterium]|nr:BrnT family toxin [Thermoanaerobaculia bacterium]